MNISFPPITRIIIWYKIEDKKEKEKGWSKKKWKNRKKRFKESWKNPCNMNASIPSVWKRIPLFVFIDILLLLLLWGLIVFVSEKEDGISWWRETWNEMKRGKNPERIPGNPGHQLGHRRGSARRWCFVPSPVSIADAKIKKIRRKGGAKEKCKEEKENGRKGEIEREREREREKEREKERENYLEKRSVVWAAGHWRFGWPRCPHVASDQIRRPGITPVVFLCPNMLMTWTSFHSLCVCVCVCVADVVVALPPINSTNYSLNLSRISSRSSSASRQFQVRPPAGAARRRGQLNLKLKWKGEGRWGGRVKEGNLSQFSPSSCPDAKAPFSSKPVTPGSIQVAFLVASK